MFERHRREFERSLLRLQKLDVYNFFSDDDIPPEFDECYDDSIQNDKTTLATTTTTLDTSIIMPPSSSLLNENLKDDKEKTDTITFPSHPPYNFVVLRKRLQQDRYILDRLRIEACEEKFCSDGTKITTTNDDKRGRSPSFSIQHPIGVHWELFRDDVMGMCNAAVERNSDNFDDGSAGTLSNTAEKIKTAMEQIYEKTGRRQSQEMELSNDAHRFTKVMEASENKEAALQGKSWRKKGKV